MNIDACPTVETKHGSTDYISREAAIEAITTAEPVNNGGIRYNRYPPSHDEVLQRINSLPAADVREVKRGKWEYSFHEEDGLEICECVCSVCHNYKETFAKWIYDDGQRNWFNFCPNCGADMRGTDDAS